MSSLRRFASLAVAAALLAACARGVDPGAADPPANAPPPELAQIQAKAAGQDAPVRVIMRLATAPGDATPMIGRAAMMQMLRAEGVMDAVPLSDEIPLVVAEMNAAQLEAAGKSGRIAAIAEDQLSFLSLAQSTRQIRAPEVWSRGGRGAGQAVAILDTGVDVAHPFFGGRVVEEACFSSASIAFGARSVCPNGLGEQIGAGAARPCAADGCDHGTHVAGIAAGASAAFNGAAPEAPIIAIQVFSLFEDRPGGPRPCAGSGQASPCIASFTSDQIRGLDYVRRLAADRVIAAANMSLGGGRETGACDTDFTADSIGQLRQLGVATVIAAGNNGFGDAVSRPGCISAAFTVGAVAANDALAPFSNRGQLVDVLAPGVGVNSAIPGGRFGVKSGTSMAAPHVAGAIAALKSARPGASMEEAAFALASTGRDVSGRPRIDMAAALAAIPAGAATTSATPQTFLAPTATDIAATRKTVTEISRRPGDEVVRMLVRPKWPNGATEDARRETLARVAAAARARGCRLVEPRPTQGLVVVEGTPAEIVALAQSDWIGAMQEEIRARPQPGPR